MTLPSSDGDKRPLLEISPLSGLLPPNGRAAVDITFCPGDERPYNFNLVCNSYDATNPPMANVLWLFYASKVLDFVDTFFIVIGKK